MRHTRELAKKLILVLVGVLAAFLVAEVLTRWLVPDPGFLFENQIGLFVPDPLLGFRNKPNFRGFAQGTTRVETNGLGYRGPEASRRKPVGTFRILGLGDSVMWGVGVQEGDTYLRLLEGLLNGSRSNESPRFEVINTASIGYSTHQELLTLQRDGVALCPDVVLLGFLRNDAYPTEDPFFNVNEFHRPPKENVQRRDYHPAPPVRSYFHRFLRAQARIWKEYRQAMREEMRASSYGWPPGSFDERAWPIVQEHLKSMQRLAQEEGFKLLIVIFPAKQRFAQPHPPEERVRDFLQAEGFSYLDLSDTFLPQLNHAYRDSMHLSRDGHRLAATAIFRSLADHAWLPPEGANSARLCESISREGTNR
jgi:lysophospholipase L1-like esterase